MNNVTLTTRKAEHDREIENLWSDDHALRVSTRGETHLNEIRNAEFTPLIELDSSNGLSTVYRDEIITTNSGSVTNTNGEHRLSTGTTSGSTAELETKERGRYQPGLTCLPGLAIRRPTTMTEDQEIRWGYFDDTDGFFFGEDSTGVFVRLRHNGTDEPKVYQSEWNADSMDGTGGNNNPSGLALDLTQVVAYRFPFLWYGEGPIEMGLIGVGPDNKSKYIAVHRFGPLDGEIILSNPKLPINAEADNGTTTGDVQIFIGGRHFGVVGRYEPNRRQTAQERLSVSTSTTLIPLVSFRKKDNRQDESISVKIGGFGLATDTNSVWKIILDGSLTGASFGSVDDVPDSETALEADTSATAISGGTAVDKGLAVGGQGNSSNLAGIKKLGLDIPDDTVVTLCIRTISGTGTATGMLTLEEEF